jgi:hypothetical protein
MLLLGLTPVPVRGSPPQQAKLAEPPLLAQEWANDFANVQAHSLSRHKRDRPSHSSEYLFSKPFCIVCVAIKILTLKVFLGSNKLIKKFL